MLLAALLSLAVLVLWQFIFPPPKPPSKPAATETAPSSAKAVPGKEAPATGSGEAASTGGQATIGETTATAPHKAAAKPAPAKPEAAIPAGTAAAKEERPVIETSKFRAELSNRGAELLSYVLKGQTDAKGNPVDLVRRRERGPYPFALTTGAGGASPLNSALFSVERTKDKSGHTAIDFRYSGSEGAAQKRFTFLDGGIVKIEISVPGEASWGIYFGPGVRNPSAKELDNRFEERDAVYLDGSDVKTEKAEKEYEDKPISTGAVRWFGLEDTYFLTALVPAQPMDRAVLHPLLVQRLPSGVFRFQAVPPKDKITSAEKKLSRSFSWILYPRGREASLTAYLGTKQYDRLAAMPYGFERTVHWGIFGFISRPLLWGLQWIYKHIVPNYGWAIIIITLLIKLVLFPLTAKGQASMQKMQKVNPKIQAIRKKYRGKMRDKNGKMNYDVQKKMNDEIMALYREEGVSPAGGCLPMLIQIPVLWAFYELLAKAIEIRHQPWIFWIKDLSAADPYYILPIVMGATQFLQQKFAPMSADPTQKKIFLLMPVVMTVLFLGFPSGMVLYWLTNNVLTIVQQWLYNLWQEKKKAAAAA